MNHKVLDSIKLILNELLINCDCRAENCGILCVCEWIINYDTRAEICGTFCAK